MQLLNANRPMLALVLVTAAVYLFLQYDQGWIAHDEGLLGQSATRVLDGELPHIDFDEPYTGGLTMLHAMAMKLLGIRSTSLRMVLLLFSIAAIGATYLIAKRFCPPWLAAFVTWITIVWSVPNYFAGLPSWYNLFFAIFGSLALIKYDERDKRAWLVVAGICGGLSFLVKVSGLYFVAAGLLYLVYHDQRTSGHDNTFDSKQSKRYGFATFTTVSLVAFSVVLVMLVRRRATPMDLIHFVLPGVLLSGFLIMNQFRQGGGTSIERFKRLTLTVAWFAGGVLVPIAVFLIPYVRRAGVGSFLDGVFILPQKRVEFADYPLPPLSSLLALVPLACVMVLPLFFRRKQNPLWLTAVAWIASPFMIMVAWQSPLYETVWDSVRSLIPLATVVGCAMLLRRSRTNGDSVPVADSTMVIDARHDGTLFLLLAMSAMISLVQFPYSFAIYFCYSIPLGILALAAIIQKQSTAPTHLHLAVAVFYFAFASVWLNHSRVQRMGTTYVHDDQSTELDLPRSGLLVSRTQAKLYEDVVKEIWRHSDDDSFIYAELDCPEIYFLSGRKNPTRSFYEFFEENFPGNPADRVERIALLLESHSVDVVVLHWHGEFSGSVSLELSQLLAARYPHVTHFLRDPVNEPHAEPVFSVAWREPSL